MPVRRLSTQAAPQGRILELEDTKKLYQSKSTSELVFSFGILKFCSYEGLVQFSTKVFNTIRGTPLERVVLSVVRRTFYKQFCSGSTIAESKPALDRLAKHGIGTILEYAIRFV
jgi:proline dehydrogenase